MLFEPIKIGHNDLQHRVVLAPLTRKRNTSHNVATDDQVQYYQQRASSPGTLLISEATGISEHAGVDPRMPGIWITEQAKHWKKVTQAVHAKHSFIFQQLWALGRKSRISADKIVSASPVKLDDGLGLGPTTPRELKRAEILQYVQWFREAALRSVKEAGFDGVEIHAANGYLPEQFIREMTNQRTDEYGGSVENRTLFVRQIVDSVVQALGNDPRKVGIRLSPWTRTGEMGPTNATLAEYSYLLGWLQTNYPDLAYVSIVEPRVANGHQADDVAVPKIESLSLNEWNNFVRLVWRGPLIRAGGLISHDHDPKDALELAAKDPKVLIAVGRYFISNPDLPHRLKSGLPLNHYDRTTFYTEGPHGYTDYPFA